MNFNNPLYVYAEWISQQINTIAFKKAYSSYLLNSKTKYEKHGFPKNCEDLKFIYERIFRIDSSVYKDNTTLLNQISFLENKLAILEKREKDRVYFILQKSIQNNNGDDQEVADKLNSLQYQCSELIENQNVLIGLESSLNEEINFLKITLNEKDKKILEQEKELRKKWMTDYENDLLWENSFNDVNRNSIEKIKKELERISYSTKVLQEESFFECRKIVEFQLNYNIVLNSMVLIISWINSVFWIFLILTQKLINFINKKIKKIEAIGNEGVSKKKFLRLLIIFFKFSLFFLIISYLIFITSLGKSFKLDSKLAVDDFLYNDFSF